MQNDSVLDDHLRDICQGKAVVMSHSDYEKLCGSLGNDVASIPNPNRVGILDALLVGKITTPEIQAYRQLHGLEAVG